MSFIKGGSEAAGKKVALTFDDGPDAVYTVSILEILKTYGIKAAFFLTGENMEQYPEVVQKIYREGHEVGNHSYNHVRLSELPKETVYHNQISRAAAVFKQILGFNPRLYRPPYGAITKTQIEYLEEKGYLQVRWLADSLDWVPRENAPEKILSRIVTELKDGGIVLLHSGRGDRSNTVTVLPRIIEELDSKGYRFCTVTEMPGEDYFSQTTG